MARLCGGAKDVIRYDMLQYGLTSWVSTVATAAGLDAAAAAALPSAFWLWFTLGRVAAAVCCGRQMRCGRLRSAPLLSASLLGAAASLFVLQAGNTLAPGGSSTVLWAGVALLGAFLGPVWGAMLALFCEESGRHLRTRDTVAVVIASRLGVAAQQTLLSLLLAQSGFDHRFYVAALGLMLAASAATYAGLWHILRGWRMTARGAAPWCGAVAACCALGLGLHLGCAPAAREEARVASAWAAWDSCSLDSRKVCHGAEACEAGLPAAGGLLPYRRALPLPGGLFAPLFASQALSGPPLPELAHAVVIVHGNPRPPDVGNASEHFCGAFYSSVLAAGSPSAAAASVLTIAPWFGPEPLSEAAWTGLGAEAGSRRAAYCPRRPGAVKCH
jgi:hypothetical protein